jgi:hypothetical protein
MIVPNENAYLTQEGGIRILAPQRFRTKYIPIGLASSGLVLLGWMILCSIGLAAGTSY